MLEAESSLHPRTLRYKGHIPGLDVLRGVAILVVVLFHGFAISWQELRGLPRIAHFLIHFGYTGVHLFFLLSGFLITGILLDSKDQEGYYRNFYIRRALRILPAYLLMLVVLKAWLPISWKYLLACLLYIANMARLVGGNINEYSGFWSLAVEEQFYLIWPTVVRRSSHRSLLKIVAACIVICPLLRGTAAFFPGVDNRYKTWMNADYLLYGAAISLALREGLIHTDNIRKFVAALLAASVPLVGLSMYLYTIEPDHRWAGIIFASVGLLPFMGLYAAMLLIAIATNEGTKSEATVKRLPHLRFLSFFGYISYGLYLVHPFVWEKYSRAVTGTWLANTFSLTSEFVGFLIAASISVSIAYLSRRFFEDPILRMKTMLAPSAKKQRLAAVPAALPAKGQLQPTIKNS